jgi:hypothetical protein
MLDRQDIDALLIGALYGELTPADEARLQTHLESHPTDKNALADLTSARNAVRESRFLTVQLEPPQAVSALLLQEASRRAPAKVASKDDAKEGWFQRFVASFARHPAWAAAAMMVLVVGVAGTMYLRGGDKFADQTTSSRAVDEAAPAAIAPTPLEEAKQLEMNAGSGYAATLAEGGAPAGAAIGGADKPTDAKDSAQEREQQPKAAVAAKPAPNRTYFGTETRAPKPKDLDGVAQTKGGAQGDLGGESANDRGRIATTGAVRPSDPAPAPRTEKSAPVVATPAPPPPLRAPQTVTRGAGGGAAPGVSDDQFRDGKLEEDATKETTWAREQHTKVTNAVRANNCKEASTLAVQLSNRAPAYYTQNVEQDRALKQCMTYINAEREREAERQQRARALQKRNLDEADRAKRPAADKSSK